MVTVAPESTNAIHPTSTKGILQYVAVLQSRNLGVELRKVSARVSAMEASILKSLITRLSGKIASCRRKIFHRNKDTLAFAVEGR